MKSLIISSFSLFIVSTAVQPVWAQDTEAPASVSTSVDETTPQRLSDLGVRVNPQLGVSSFEYGGVGADGRSSTKLSGGATFEFGAEMRKLETGLLIMQTGASGINSTYLTIPMMAKIRLVSQRVQSWYGKFGFMTAFEMSSNRNAETNNVDVLGALGVGGRLYFNPASDFIVEATYNHGFLDAVRTSGFTSNRGFLVMAGMSFRI